MDIDFPFHFDNRGRTADTGYADHIRDMIEQLLFTSPGERVNRPDFGCGLRQLVFAPNRPELEATLQFTVQGSLERWLSDVIDVSEVAVESEEATLRVTVAYAIRATGETRSDNFQRGM